MLKRIFGSKRDEVVGEWGKLHNEELKVLYSSPNIVRVMKLRRIRWAGHVARMGDGRGMYRVLVRKLGGKRPLGGAYGRIILRWIHRSGIWGMDWIQLAQDRDRWRTLAIAVMSLRVA